jgi:hypothetical protein
MHRLRRLRFTYANVVASIALFVALGGTGYAATQLAPNSVGTRQLKRGAVTAAKINARTRRALKGAAGPAGTTGPQGARGPAGANGVNGVNGVNGTKGADGTVSSKIGYVIGPIGIAPGSVNANVIRVSVPRPGKFVAIARINIALSGLDRDEVVCGMGAEQTSLAPGVDVVAAKGIGVEQTLTLMYAGDFRAPLQPLFAGFFVYCSTPAGTSAAVKQAKITLIQSDEVGIVDSVGT